MIHRPSPNRREHEAVNRQLRQFYRELARKSLQRVQMNHRTGRCILKDKTKILIEVNAGCSEGCSTCFRLGQRSMMAEDLLARLVDYIKKRVFMGIFLGGEPTECLDRILKTTREKEDVLFVLTTNGERFTPAVVQKVKRAGNIFPVISLDGIGDANDRSRKPGSFEIVQKGIATLRQHMVSFGVNTVANQFNIGQILNGELPQFIDHIGACTWEILRYYPIGMDDKQFQRLMLDKEQNRLLEEFRRTPGQTRQYGFMFTAPESNTKKCIKSLVVTPNGHLTYCPFSVWGLGKIEPTDTDDEITYKLQSKREEWAVLISSTSGFCPLQKNTEGYIDFFEKHGTPFQRPTGILDRNTAIHEHYRRTVL